ncbi:MAG: restriction endonuclease subunit S [Chitinispirillaceae bacterium]|nr:restriction endonuclease subunit S [Chitinispirillaceae bacterium]
METTVGEITKAIVGGGTPSKKNGAYYSGSIPFMTVKDMKINRPNKTVDHISEEAVRASSTNIIPADTLIISTRMGLGKIVRANFATAINQDLKALFIHENISKMFFEYWYRSQSKILENLGKGTTVKGIRLEVLESIRFPLPPLPEQHRIADKLDSLMARIESCKARLERVPELMKRFRQTVLKMAVTGRLTEDWRAGKGLPERIEKTIGSVIESISYGTSKKSGYNIQNGIPVLRIPNVSTGLLNITDLKYSHLDEKEYQKLSLVVNDLLIIRSNGSVSLLGKATLIGKEAVGFAYAGYLIRIRVKNGVIEPHFLNLIFKTHTIREQIEISARSTTGVHNINSEEIKELRFPLPPLSEQKEIVRRVDSLFSLADKLERKYAAAFQNVNDVTTSILSKAFRGTLLPQKPADEPATILLERIKKEKSAKQQLRKKRGVK